MAMLPEEPAQDFRWWIRQAQQASIPLGMSGIVQRSRALRRMAQTLAASRDEILEANTLDLEASQEMAVPELIQDWLRLTPERLEQAIKILQDLADVADPMQPGLPAMQSSRSRVVYHQLIPLGLIALVFEALPELGAIAAGLCLRTGNSLVLRGSSEASHSNAAIVAALRSSLDDVGLPVNSIVLLQPEAGTSLRDLVTLDEWINLIIPYGRPSLVQQVVRQATAPVIRTGIGNCALYWAASGRLETVRMMIVDSHASKPEPVNAIEKVLVHEDVTDRSLESLWAALHNQGFELRAEAALTSQFPGITPTQAEEWDQPYLRPTIAFKRVQSLQQAVTWINQYSSGHADCLATESYGESRAFAASITSATTYINASPRFYRSGIQGDPIALGMSNQKGHRRGRIGLAALTTLKQVILGGGEGDG